MSQQPGSDNPAHASQRPTPRGHDGSIRETLESIIIAFVLAFMFRAFIVEAFVIPTGSMAPTLLGEHFRADCTMCGYHFTINVGDRRSEADCAMCEYPINLAASGRMINSGDRILVLKYIYEFSPPQRWDVVVFKNPVDPGQNYIKRLVGLPGEELWLVNGNVFTRPLGSDDDPDDAANGWRIERKPDEVQRAVWVPVYHSMYYPLDEGEPGLDAAVDSAHVPRRRRWEMPWQPTGQTRQAWQFDRQGPRWRFDHDEPGALRFAFDERTRFNYYPYNSLADSPGARSGDPIEDMRVAATLMPDEAGLGATLQVATQQHQFRGRIDADGEIALQMRDKPRVTGVDEEPWRTVAQAETSPLPGGRGTRLELWHADQRLSLWRDGQLLAESRYEQDPQDLLARRDRRAVEPTVQVAVDGPAVTVRDVNLDRDLYYTASPRSNQTLGGAEPTPIEEGHFYTLGDNSPHSKDSRLWSGVDPWLEDLTDVPVGFVPEEMMIGRAFYVYFPAMWRLRDDGMAVIPNFADMRFIR